ncbi:hypothetical protein [Haloarcula salina]|uniref:Uncharacterized protein n=1 Tax=Haloarcula salina TaxID=1429914 RepID=A0AA41FY50_9EURY|nr:hypothetical protein [Haloarcula salina]MBV0900763.1 hypothetical protein [Haloarcula salina]
MQGGVCGIVDGTFDVVGPYTETETEREHELSRSVQVDRVFSLPSGKPGFEGHAAAERLVTRSDTEIRDGEIRVTESTVKETVRTAFAGVPGEVVVAESGGGEFAFDLIGAETDTAIERGAFDLSGFLDAHRSGSPWKAGFYDADGHAQKGTVYGDDLLRDDAFEPVLDTASLNQLGIDYEYRGRTVKVDLTESGFVTVHRPSGMDTAAFLEFLIADVLPHSTG